MLIDVRLIRKYRGAELKVMPPGVVEKKFDSFQLWAGSSVMKRESCVTLIYSTRWLRARVAVVLTGERMGMMLKEPVALPPPVPRVKEVPMAVPHCRFDQRESTLTLNSTNRS